MSNKWCYEHFISKTKPKNIFKRLYYKIWLMCGVSPSGLYLYNLGHYLKGGKSMIEETKLYAGDEVVEKIKTIKIIDLWNKIAKAYLGSNEYIPKRIKYRMYDEEHSTFTYDEEEYEYYNGEEFLSVPNHHLNDTVEIIEEDKELNAEQASVNFEKFQKAFNRVKKELFPLINEMQKIEEDNNKIEKLKHTTKCTGIDEDGTYYTNEFTTIELAAKIDEIIDHINNLEKR